MPCHTSVFFSWLWVGSLVVFGGLELWQALWWGHTFGVVVGAATLACGAVQLHDHAKKPRAGAARAPGDAGGNGGFSSTDAPHQQSAPSVDIERAQSSPPAAADNAAAESSREASVSAKTCAFEAIRAGQWCEKVFVRVAMLLLLFMSIALLMVRVSSLDRAGHDTFPAACPPELLPNACVRVAYTSPNLSGGAAPPTLLHASPHMAAHSLQAWTKRKRGVTLLDVREDPLAPAAEHGSVSGNTSLLVRLRFIDPVLATADDGYVALWRVDDPTGEVGCTRTAVQVQLEARIGIERSANLKRYEKQTRNMLIDEYGQAAGGNTCERQQELKEEEEEDYEDGEDEQERSGMTHKRQAGWRRSWGVG